MRRSIRSHVGPGQVEVILTWLWGTLTCICVVPMDRVEPSYAVGSGDEAGGLVG